MSDSDTEVVRLYIPEKGTLAVTTFLLLFIEQKPKAYYTVNEKENVELQGTYRFTSKH